MVNETFANRHRPGQSALGKQFAANTGSNRVWMTVMGVVKEIRERGIDSPLKAAMYTPWPSRPTTGPSGGTWRSARRRRRSQSPPRPGN